jgi:hypothetical protein
MTSVPPLPDTFETTQASRMAAAHDVGDHAQVEQIRRHLVTEGSVDSADAARLDAVSRASLVAKEMIDATSVGNATRAAALRRRLIDEFDPGTVSAVIGAMLFTAGRKQGWLPEDDHDRLVTFTAGMSDEVRAIVRQIRRGRP